MIPRLVPKISPLDALCDVVGVGVGIGDSWSWISVSKMYIVYSYIYKARNEL